MICGRPSAGAEERNSRAMTVIDYTRVDFDDPRSVEPVTYCGFFGVGFDGDGMVVAGPTAPDRLSGGQHRFTGPVVAVAQPTMTWAGMTRTCGRARANVCASRAIGTTPTAMRWPPRAGSWSRPRWPATSPTATSTGGSAPRCTCCAPGWTS